MSNKIPKDQIEREFNEARELNEYYEKEIEKLKKEKELILFNLNNVYEHYKEFKDEKIVTAGMKGIIDIWGEG